MIERIVALMDYLNMTAGQFADRISVQRSNISHIISGRNKPSLEFVQKVIRQFPEISTEWLIFGKGDMLTRHLESKRQEERNIPQSKPADAMPEQIPSVEKVILLFSDGTFSLYSPDRFSGIIR